MVRYAHKRKGGNNMGYIKKLLNMLYGRNFMHNTVMYNISEPVLIFPYKPYNRVSDWKIWFKW